MSKETPELSLREWNKGQTGTTGGRNVVTIYKSNKIVLPEPLVEEYFPAPGVRLYENKKTDIIGLKPSEIDHPNAYKLRTKDTGRKAMISASSFLEHFTQDFDETRDYQVEWDKAQDMLIVKLNQPVIDD